MQNWRGRPDKESQGPSYNILSKNLRLQHSKDSVNTASCSGWSMRSLWVTVIGHRLLSRLPDITHVTLSPRPSHFCILQAIKNWRWEQPGNEAISQLHDVTSYEKQTDCTHLECTLVVMNFTWWRWYGSYLFISLHMYSHMLKYHPFFLFFAWSMQKRRGKAYYVNENYTVGRPGNEASHYIYVVTCWSTSWLYQ